MRAIALLPFPIAALRAEAMTLSCMTMKVVKQLSPETQVKIKSHININLRPLAAKEQARCAKDRLNLWLQAEPDYRSRKYKKAHADERLWAFCQRLYPEAALAQVYFATGNIGIDWHRDASFAERKAVIVNLGSVLLETEINSDKRISLELTGGEVIEFNCKLPHRAVPRSENRIGIAIWADKISLQNPSNWL